ncbi:unnamed protein product [Paramecium sonneborni]|uniref:Uncharacterized protein n=1 Tax=Paramecium sonneborni TaxID=65129 RepID=A0A8S1NY34_9CILI|nr:unnamed protein product [Paramecium sonneborni]
MKHKFWVFEQAASQEIKKNNILNLKKPQNIQPKLKKIISNTNLYILINSDNLAVNWWEVFRLVYVIQQ